MSIFIKPGFWDEKKLAPKHWFNLTKYIASLAPPGPPGITSQTYTALLNQTGTNAPVPTVIDNSLSGTLTYTRTGVGAYEISYSLGALSDTNCIIYFPKNSISTNISFSAGKLLLTTPSGPPADGYLVNDVLDIKIFI